MPSKRTNDSVDRILEELSHEQAERGIRDSVTDRQVDAILQSLGHGSMEESSGGGSALGPIQKEDLPDITLGKGNNFNTEDRFSTAVLDDLLGAPVQKEKHAFPNPAAAKTEKSHPSAPTLENSSSSARGTSDGPEKPSVRQELREIQAQRKKEAEAPHHEEPAAPRKKAAQKTTRHQPPKPRKKPKSKER